MKKISVLLIAVVALDFTACGANKSTTKSKNTSDKKNKAALVLHKHKAKGTLLVRKRMWF
ncbi:hypothetical protein IMAU30003_00187 [Lactobacillus helveticus]|uniref:Uncharacterized protein n=1 Tax=Lactobacillus helveticus TaxID=1587 RepID=A0A9Q5G7J8_LACHE|nr:hypothetical protein [Lactobacillus helveticus]